VDIAALGYTDREASDVHFKLSNGNKSVTAPKPVRKDSHLSPEMARRNNQIRLFLEHEDNSNIRQG
jgi:hypothetical protein